MLQEIQKLVKQSKAFDSKEEGAFLGIQVLADRQRTQFNELFKRSKLTGSQYNVLRILRGAGKEGLPCGEIGERMINRDSDITRMLDRLEKRELIMRERQRDDRRVVLTLITEKGLGLLSKLDDPVNKLHKSQMGHLSSRDLDSLIKLLWKAMNRGG